MFFILLISAKPASMSGQTYSGSPRQVFNEELTITSCTFTNFKNINEQGGAIYQKSGFLAISGSSFSNCEGKEGGAIFSLDIDSITLHETSFTGCGCAKTGGSLYISNGKSLQMEGGKIETSVSQETAGGAYIAINGKLNITGAQLNQNTASGKAGSLFILCEEAYFLEASFDTDRANEDAAAFYLKASKNAEIDRCKFKQCWTSVNGSLYIDCVHIVVRSSFFSDGRASVNGGALFLISSDIKSHVEVMHCNFSICVASVDGGSIFISAGYAQVSHCVFGNGKSGYRGGAIFMKQVKEGNDDMRVEFCTFYNDVASTYGGALYIDSYSYIVTENNFSCNAAGYAGGAAFLKTSNVGVITNNTFSTNNQTMASTTEGFAAGGALFVTDYSASCSIKISDCCFSTNNVAAEGRHVASSNKGTMVFNNLCMSGKQEDKSIYVYPDTVAGSGSVSYECDQCKIDYCKEVSFEPNPPKPDIPDEDPAKQNGGKMSAGEVTVTVMGSIALVTVAVVAIVAIVKKCAIGSAAAAGAVAI